MAVFVVAQRGRCRQGDTSNSFVWIEEVLCLHDLLDGGSLLVGGSGVGAVAVFSESDASLGVSGLVLCLSSLESLQKVGSNLGLISGSAEDPVDDVDDWDVPLELVELSGLTGNELLALLGLNLELLEGRLQLAHLGSQV